MHSALPFLIYKESDILEPMRARSGSFVFNIRLYRPSKPDGWSDLYRQIQRSGYKVGMQLNCYMYNKNKRYNIKCFRGKLFKVENKQMFLDGKCFVEEAEGISIRRIKQPKCPTRKTYTEHVSTTKAMKKENLCPFQFSVHVHKKYDIFYVKGKFGCLRHENHPSLSEKEVTVCKKAASKGDKDMATILIDSDCPLTISKRIFATKNGFTFSPSFLSGNVNDGTVCDNLMKFFKGHTDIKSVCLYDDWHREEFFTVNKALS